ncbi:MAG: acyltransferase [Pseudomonadota bacterium]
MLEGANRFDALRLAFATTVFAYHAVALAALTPGGAWEQALAQAAELSIQGFFVISGALVYGSWTRSDGLADYAGKRFRRLYPAYAVVILAPAALALAMTGAAGEVARYVAANLVFLNFLAPELPEWFDDHRFTAVNGALWTLKIEVMFYAILPVLAWLMARLGPGRWMLLAAIYAAAEAWRLGVPRLDVGLTPELAARIARQLPGQMSFFAAGVVLWLLRDQARGRAKALGLAGAGLAAASFVAAPLEPLRAAGLACLVAWAAFAPGPALPAARWGDVSYGVYILHFPVLQALIAAGVFAVSPLAGLLAAAILVFAAAALMWRFVERPALRPASHYRQASGG